MNRPVSIFKLLRFESALNYAEKKINSLYIFAPKIKDQNEKFYFDTFILHTDINFLR